MKQMRWLGAADAVMTRDRRDAILARIADGRQTAASVADRLAPVSQITQTPLGADQSAFNAANKTFQATDPIVTAVEKRLSPDASAWKDLSDQEQKALADWETSIATMSSVTSKYFPTAFERDWKTLLLAAIGLAAIFGPLLLSSAPITSIRLFPRPPSLPPSGPGRERAGLMIPPSAAERPTGPPRPGILRPSVTVMEPPPSYRPAGSVPAGQAASLNIPIPPRGTSFPQPPRTFTQPLGPGGAGSAAARSPFGGGRFVYPRPT